MTANLAGLGLGIGVDVLLCVSVTGYDLQLWNITYGSFKFVFYLILPGMY